MGKGHRTAYIYAILWRFGSQHRLWVTTFPCGANGFIGLA